MAKQLPNISFLGYLTTQGLVMEYFTNTPENNVLLETRGYAQTFPAFLQMLSELQVIRFSFNNIVRDLQRIFYSGAYSEYTNLRTYLSEMPVEFFSTGYTGPISSDKLMQEWFGSGMDILEYALRQNDYHLIQIILERTQIFKNPIHSYMGFVQTISMYKLLDTGLNFISLSVKNLVQIVSTLLNPDNIIGPKSDMIGKVLELIVSKRDPVDISEWIFVLCHEQSNYPSNNKLTDKFFIDETRCRFDSSDSNERYWTLRITKVYKNI